MKVKKKLFFNLLIISLIFFIDRLSKNFILHQNSNESNFNLNITSFLDFNLVWNKGIAFGLLSFETNFLYNLTTLIILVIIIFLIYLIYKENSFSSYLYGLICGGAIGNVFDRLNYGSVIDFIDFNYNNFHWFIFIVAVIFITLGVFCLIFKEIFLNKKNEN